MRFISMVKVTLPRCRAKAGVEARDRQPGQGSGSRSPGRGRRPNSRKGARAPGRLDPNVASEPRSDPEMIPRFVTLDTGLKGGTYQHRDTQEAEQQQQKRGRTGSEGTSRCPSENNLLEPRNEDLTLTVSDAPNPRSPPDLQSSACSINAHDYDPFQQGYKAHSAKSKGTVGRRPGEIGTGLPESPPRAAQAFTGACAHRLPLPGSHQTPRFLPSAHCLCSLVYMMSLCKPRQLRVFRHQPRASLFSFLPLPSSGCTGSSLLPPGCLQSWAQLPCGVWDLNSLTWD